jgi:transcription elongation factor SPT6
MSARDFVEGEAMLDDDENEDELADDYEGEGEGEVRQGAGTANHYDSSEEDDDDDDDEEAARAVCFHLEEAHSRLGVTDTIL